jgi:hypothetical protein
LADWRKHYAPQPWERSGDEVDKGLPLYRNLNMNLRSSKYTVEFSNVFCLPGNAQVLPAGPYEVIVEEECLQGPTFETWRRITTYLLVQQKGARLGQVDLCKTTERALFEALRRDDATHKMNEHSGAALPPPEDSK